MNDIYTYPDRKHLKMLRDVWLPSMHEWELHREFQKRKFAVAISSPNGISLIEDVLSPLVIKTEKIWKYSHANWMVEFLVAKVKWNTN